jgi:hypothetical protein
VVKPRCAVVELKTSLKLEIDSEICQQGLRSNIGAAKLFECVSRSRGHPGMDWLLRVVRGLASRTVTILVVLGVAALAWLVFLNSQ